MEQSESTPGSGNVFQDLGLPDPEGSLVKADLALAISRAMRQRDLTQTQAAELMGLDQPKVSAITRGRLSGFSVERLMQCLRALDQDVTISVRPAEGAVGQIRVVA
jgi:predicted XRE-type DNA-binding protein